MNGSPKANYAKCMAKMYTFSERNILEWLVTIELFHGLTSLLINSDYMNSVHFMIQGLSAVIRGVAVEHWSIAVQVRKGGSWKCTIYGLSNAEEVIPAWNQEWKNFMLDNI